MENLTKQQIVLLTLLVSFVTSLATGIVTVSLMDQEPQGVTQTINRIVERTIEKVVEAPAQSASVITKETVVVSVDDMTVASVAKNSEAIIRLFTNSAFPGANATSSFVGLGVVLSADGLAVTVADSIDPVNGDYEVVLPNKKRYQAKVVSMDAAERVAILKIIKPIDDLSLFTASSLASSKEIKLGQSVVALSGEVNNKVYLGAIASVFSDNAPAGVAATTTAPISYIETNLSATGIIAGSPLLNLSGEVVGLALSKNKLLDGGQDDSQNAVFIPSLVIIEALKKSNEKSEFKYLPPKGSI
jgi:S1-C subfamily serine protease